MSAASLAKTLLWALAPLAARSTPTSSPTYSYSGTNYVCADNVNFGIPNGGSYTQGGSGGVPTPTSLTDCFSYCSGLSTCSGFWHQIYYNTDGSVNSHQCGYFSVYISSPPWTTAYDTVDEFWHAGNGGEVCKSLTYTSSPTVSPAPSISLPPSPQPTAAPSSSAPTPLPLPTPTVLPSSAPTQLPTPVPIPSPTAAPTRPPSPAPSLMPTVKPDDQLNGARATARIVPIGAALVCAVWLSSWIVL